MALRSNPKGDEVEGSLLRNRVNRSPLQVPYLQTGKIERSAEALGILHISQIFSSKQNLLS